MSRRLRGVLEMNSAIQVYNDMLDKALGRASHPILQASLRPACILWSENNNLAHLTPSSSMTALGRGIASSAPLSLPDSSGSGPSICWRTFYPFCCSSSEPARWLSHAASGSRLRCCSAYSCCRDSAAAYCCCRRSTCRWWFADCAAAVPAASFSARIFSRSGRLFGLKDGGHPLLLRGV